MYHRKFIAGSLSVLMLCHQTGSANLIQPKTPLPLVDGSQLAGSWPYQFAKIQPTATIQFADKPTVLFIQDVHQNSEAQLNISQLTSHLLNKYPVDVVGLEGTFDDIPLSRFQNFPNRPAVESVADYLLRENRISGPIHAGLTTPTDTKFTGVDDKDAYLENVKAYKAAAVTEKVLKAKLRSEMAAWYQGDWTLLNPRLRAFDEKRIAYHHEKINLASYAHYLMNQDFLENSGQFYPQVETYLSATELERTLDFKVVERERNKIVTKLMNRLSDKETEQFVQKTVEFRRGIINNSRFYKELMKLCSAKSLSIPFHSSFRIYLQYLELVETIDGEKLDDEVVSIERSLIEHLAQSPNEKRIMDQSEKYLLAEKLLSFSMSKQEWLKYQGLKSNRELKSMAPFEKFYQMADVRDAKMAERFMEELRESKTGIGLLIAGGYHSRGIQKILRDNQFNVIVASPKISKVDTSEGTSYLSVFQQEKTPVEKIFSGQKLFLAQDPVKETLPGIAMGVVGMNALSGAKDATRTTFSELTDNISDVPSVIKMDIQTDEEGFDVTLETGRHAVINHGKAKKDAKGHWAISALWSTEENSAMSLWDIVMNWIALIFRQPTEGQRGHNIPVKKEKRNSLDDGSETLANGLITVEIGSKSDGIQVKHKVISSEDRPYAVDAQPVIAGRINMWMGQVVHVWSQHLSDSSKADPHFFKSRFSRYEPSINLRTTFIYDNDREYYMSNHGLEGIVIDDEVFALPAILGAFFLNHESYSNESAALYGDLQFYSWMLQHRGPELEEALKAHPSFEKQSYFQFLKQYVNKSETVQRKAVVKFILREALEKLAQARLRANKIITFRNARRNILATLSALFPPEKQPAGFATVRLELANAGGHFSDDDRLKGPAEQVVKNFVRYYKDQLKETLAPDPNQSDQVLLTHVLKVQSVIKNFLHHSFAIYERFPWMLNWATKAQAHSFFVQANRYTKFHYDRFKSNEHLEHLFSVEARFTLPDFLEMDPGTLLLGEKNGQEKVYVYLGDPWVGASDNENHQPIFYEWSPTNSGDLISGISLLRLQDSHHLILKGYIASDSHDTVQTTLHFPGVDLTEPYAKIASDIEPLIDQTKESLLPGTPLIRQLDQIISELSGTTGHLHPLKKQTREEMSILIEDLLNETSTNLGVEKPVDESVRGKDVVIILKSIDELEGTRYSHLHLNEANSVNIAFEEKTDLATVQSKWPGLRGKIRLMENNGLIQNGKVRPNGFSSGLPARLTKNKQNLAFLFMRKSVIEGETFDFGPGYENTLCVIVNALDEMSQGGIVTTLDRLKAALASSSHA